MELNDLKKDWEAVSNQALTQSKLTQQTINQMTIKKYHSVIGRIKYSEWAGSLICLLGAGFIVSDFNKLDNLFLQLVGVAAILILIAVPVISLLGLNRVVLPVNVNKPYSEALREFVFQKLRFQKLQQVNGIFSYLLLVAIIVLMSKFFGGKNIANDRYFWIFSFSFGYIYLIFISKLVKRFYGKTLDQAEELLKELGA